MTKIETRQPRDDFGRFAGGSGGLSSSGSNTVSKNPSPSELSGDKSGASSGSKVSQHDNETGGSEDALAHTELGIDRAAKQVDSAEKIKDLSSTDKIRVSTARDRLDQADVDRDEINPSKPRNEGMNSDRFQSAKDGVNEAGRLLQNADHPDLKSIGDSLAKISKNMPSGDTRSNGWLAVHGESRSVAYSNLELRANSKGSVLTGYAAVFDSPSEPLPWTEFVKRGAFTKTLKDGADVRLLIDHEGIPLARTKSGTLSLIEDERGLFVEADLDPSNPDAARVISAMRRGDMNQMSFAFRTIKDAWAKDRSTRDLKEVQLYDVSIVTFPAYEETVAELRSRKEIGTVDTASSLLLRKNQLAIARHK
jgi:HK97 family phage prohead protease